MKSKLFFILFFTANTLVFAQLGINTTSPKSTLDVNGNLSLMVITQNGGPSGSATPITNGYYINLDVQNATDVEYILPDATTVPGRTYVLRNLSSINIAVIFSFGGLFFASNSNSSTTSATLNTNDSSKTLVFYSDGTNWTYGAFGF